MSYDLPLVRPFGKIVSEDFEANKAIKEKIEGITDFEERLTWYNTNIRSLSTFAMDGPIYFEWGSPDEKIKIYCGCKTCRSQPFFCEYEKIFVKLSAKELQRLLDGINNASSYKDKLSFLFNTKGYIPSGRPPAVFANVPFGESDNDAAAILNITPVVDLRPKTDEEMQVFNQFVIDDFEMEYRKGNHFTKAYAGFDFEKEKLRLDKRLLNPATDKRVLLKHIKTTIESHFGYGESQYIDSKQKQINSNVLQQIDGQLEQIGHMSQLFTRLCFGETIDLLSVSGLNSYSLLNYTHVYEIFRYYQYVKKLFERPENLEQFENEKEANVPFIGHLLSNLNIKKRVLDAYFSLEQQPENNRKTLPFQISIYGAYPLMKDYEFLQSSIRAKDREPFDRVSESEIENAFKDYAKGFKAGYFSFEKDKLHDNLFQDEKTKKQIVFDIATGQSFLTESFPITIGRTSYFEGWKEAGKEAGYFYRAWYLMLENHAVFEPMFQAETTTTTSTPELPEQIESLEQLRQFFKSGEKTSDFEPLKKYIPDNYLNVHANKLTLEDLEPIKRNISKWKLLLKDLNEVPLLQEVISDTIADINLQIERYSHKQAHGGESDFSFIEKRIKHFAELLHKYNFFKLQKVEALSKSGQAQLVELIAKRALPYCIAMFDFLGFLELLKTNFKTKTDLYIEVSNWFDADKQGRTVAANIRVLSPNTNEDRSRYTAHQHKETAKNDYENIK